MPNQNQRRQRPATLMSPLEKLLAIRRVELGESKAAVGRALGVPESTLRGWCKWKHKALNNLMKVSELDFRKALALRTAEEQIWVKQNLADHKKLLEAAAEAERLAEKALEDSPEDNYLLNVMNGFTTLVDMNLRLKELTMAAAAYAVTRLLPTTSPITRTTPFASTSSAPATITSAEAAAAAASALANLESSGSSASSQAAYYEPVSPPLAHSSSSTPPEGVYYQSPTPPLAHSSSLTPPEGVYYQSPTPPLAHSSSSTPPEGVYYQSPTPPLAHARYSPPSHRVRVGAQLLPANVTMPSTLTAPANGNNTISPTSNTTVTNTIYNYYNEYAQRQSAILYRHLTNNTNSVANNNNNNTVQSRVAFLDNILKVDPNENYIYANHNNVYSRLNKNDAIQHGEAFYGWLLANCNPSNSSITNTHLEQLRIILERVQKSTNTNRNNGRITKKKHSRKPKRT